MSALAMRRTWRNIALGLILATGLAAACGPEEPASPGDGHSSTSPTPTATAATESPTDPPPQGTPLPTPAPTPVPATPASRTPVPVTPEPTTIVGAPGDTLPAVSPSPGLEANVEAVGHWEPRFKGAMGDIVLLHRDGKDYALLGSAGEVHLLEIDASGEPTPGEAVLSLPGIVRALETDGELLAVVTGGDAALGLHLFDIADLRAPRALGSYGGDFLNVRLEADQAYLPAGRDGLHIVDIAEPNRLTRISRIEPWFEEAMPTEHNQPAILDAQVREGKAYLAVSEAGFVVFDVSDPSTPARIGQFGTPGYAERVALSDDGRYAYVANNVVTPFTIWAVDIRDPRNPEAAGSYEDRTVSGAVSLLHAVGDAVYFATFNTGWGGVTWRTGAVNMTDPASPVRVGNPRDAGFDVGYPSGWAFREDRAYVAGTTGLTVTDVPDIASLNGKRRLIAGIHPQQLHLFDDHAYLFSGSGLRVIDVSRPDVPARVADLPLSGRGPMRVDRDKAYFSVDRETARVLDLSDPAIPAWAGETEKPETSGCSTQRDAAVGDYCFHLRSLSSNTWGLNVAIGNGQERKVIAFLALEVGIEGGFMRSAAASHGRHVFVISEEALYVVDAADPATPRVAAKMAVDSLASSRVLYHLTDIRQGGVLTSAERASSDPFIAIRDGYAYVLKGGLWVFDLSNPVDPEAVAYHDTAATVVEVENDTVYLAGPGGELEVVRIDE